MPIQTTTAGGCKAWKGISAGCIEDWPGYQGAASYAGDQYCFWPGLCQAMQCRALAMDLTNIATYEVMKRWTDRMFAVFSQPPAPVFSESDTSTASSSWSPSSCTVGEIFNGLLKVMPMAGEPWDPPLEKLETDVSVTYFMLPVSVHNGYRGSQGDLNGLTRRDRKPPMPTSLKPISFQKSTKEKVKSKKQKTVSPCQLGLKACVPERRGVIRFGTGTTLGLAAGITMSSQACLCSAKMLQSSSSDRAPMSPWKYSFIWCPRIRSIHSMDNECVIDTKVWVERYFCIKCFAVQVTCRLQWSTFFFFG